MKKIPRWLVVVVLLAVAVAVLRLVVFRPKPLTVQTARVERGAVEETVTNTRAGTVKVRVRSKLSPQIGGRVEALPFEKGARVQAGDLLLKLDDSVQRAQLELAVNEVKTAESRAQEACLAEELALREWQRSAALEKDGIASRQAVDVLESARDRSGAACKAAKASLELARAQVELARAEVALTEVRAPFPGILADRTTEVGEWITPSPPGVPFPPVLDLLDPSTLYVSAPIDEVDSVRVMPGQAVRITVDSRPGEHFSGKLTRVAPYVLDLLEQNRTVEVEASCDDPALARSVLPGTSADIEVVLSRQENALRVPTASVAEGGKVLVVEDGRLRERALKLGTKNWQYTQVLEGLGEGDLVVTVRDSPAIKPGARVSARTGR